jgi:hypothetical protein
MIESCVIDMGRMIDPAATTAERACRTIDFACLVEGGWRLPDEWVKVDNERLRRCIQLWPPPAAPAASAPPAAPAASVVEVRCKSFASKPCATLEAALDTCGSL